MRRRRGVALVVSLVALVAIGACKDASPRSQPAPTAGSATAAGAGTGDDPWAPKIVAAPAIERPMLWAATKDGTTTYLFGTIHVGFNADTQLPAWLKAKLDGARAFAMEANLAEPGLIGMMARTDGGSLRLDLGPEAWAKLEAVIGADMARGVDKMKPIAAMTMLEASFLPKTTGMDTALEARAAAAKKPIIYFESAKRQLEIVDAFIGARDVKAFLDQLDYAKAKIGELRDAYQAGDGEVLGKQFGDDTLWKAAGRDPAQFPAFVKALLEDRNATWIPQIEKLHAEGGAFVAVGAGHLVGPGNVLDMLAARGFTISRVTGP